MTFWIVITLLVLAVMGAYAGSDDAKGTCPGSEPTAYCVL